MVGLVCATVVWGLDRWGPVGEIQLPGQKVVAVALAVLGLLVALSAVIAFFRARTTISPLRPDKTNQLVISGWYRFSRNPMYAGMLFMLLGWVLWLGQPLGVLGPGAFVAWITVFQILPEERALGAKFGESYQQYCGRVRRWI